MSICTDCGRDCDACKVSELDAKIERLRTERREIKEQCNGERDLCGCSPCLWNVESEEEAS